MPCREPKESPNLGSGHYEAGAMASQTASNCQSTDGYVRGQKPQAVSDPGLQRSDTPIQWK